MVFWNWIPSEEVAFCPEMQLMLCPSCNCPQRTASNGLHVSSCLVLSCGGLHSAIAVTKIDSSQKFNRHATIYSWHATCVAASLYRLSLKSQSNCNWKRCPRERNLQFLSGLVQQIIITWTRMISDIVYRSSTLRSVTSCARTLSWRMFTSSLVKLLSMLR